MGKRDDSWWCHSKNVYFFDSEFHRLLIQCNYRLFDRDPGFRTVYDGGTLRVQYRLRRSETHSTTTVRKFWSYPLRGLEMVGEDGSFSRTVFIEETSLPLLSPLSSLLMWLIKIIFKTSSSGLAPRKVGIKLFLLQPSLGVLWDLDP